MGACSSRALIGAGHLVDFSGCQSNSSKDNKVKDAFRKTHFSWTPYKDIFESVLKMFPCDGK